MRLIIKWLLIGVILYYLPSFIPNVTVSTYLIALIFAFILTVLHYTIKPILFVLTLPINILTLGLFSIILNTAMFSLAAYIVDGFSVNGFWAALLGAVIVSLAGEIIDVLTKPGNSR